jgi:hypothetical protein
MGNILCSRLVLEFGILDEDFGELATQFHSNPGAAN